MTDPFDPLQKMAQDLERLRGISSDTGCLPMIAVILVLIALVLWRIGSYLGDIAVALENML